MPTVLRSGAFRFYFYSKDLQEPPHVHVDYAERSAKFWLLPVRLARNYGFPEHELSEIRRIVVENRQGFLRAWHAHVRSS